MLEGPMDDILEMASQALPSYNTFLLRDFRDREMGRIVDFVDNVFKEAVRLFDGQGLKYTGYRYVSPEERAMYEIAPNSARGGVNIRLNEVSLVEFQFLFEGMKYPVRLYLPYLKDGFIIIEGVRYGIQYTIMEKVFSKSHEELTIKCLRSPVHFRRQHIAPITSMTTGEIYYIPVTSVKIHQKKSRDDKKMPTTVVHYMLCEFGYKGTLHRLGIDPDKMQIVDTIDEETKDDYEYILARKYNKSRENLYIRIDRTIWEDLYVRKIACTISHILQMFTGHERDELYDEEGTIFRIYLGRCIHGRNTLEARAKGYADQHLSSLVTYLDPTTRDRLQNAAGIAVSDIHELFVYMLKNFDYILTNMRRSDMTDCRIDILDSLLVSTIVSTIYTKFYKLERRHNTLREQDVQQLLKISPSAAIKLHNVDNIQGSVPIYGDNLLTSMNIRRIRSGAKSQSMESPENRFDPSAAIVTSICAFSDTNPGGSGQINPYLEITPDGHIVRTKIAEELDAELGPYLPYV